MDIFYQELSFEEVVQNVAFAFLSLLGEIGGFLGLLLGASVLTVCELVDFLVVSLMVKLKKGRVRPADTSHANQKPDFSPSAQNPSHEVRISIHH